MERRRLRSDEVRAARAARFAAQLGDALYELGLTHKDVAEALGVPRFTVDSWTRADAPKIPGGPNLARLCDFLEARKPGLGRALASIAGLAWSVGTSTDDGPFGYAQGKLTKDEEPTPSANPSLRSGGQALSGEKGKGQVADPRLSRPVAHPDLTNIPASLTSFIGRESQLAQVRELLASTRLLTLLGPGGIGKTRLALQVGASQLPRYQDGVWLVELAALSDPTLVAQVVATTLGVREQPGHSLAEALVAHLRPRRTLLLLDNCEHLVESCATLAGALLQACPDLRMVATSREALRISGEVLWRVPSLKVPSTEYQVPSGGRTKENNHDSALSTQYSVVSSYESVQLFLERARAAEPGFDLTGENAPAVAQICYRLDGVPLAIELAAACVRALAVEQIAVRLDDRFRLLVGGSRFALPRHQTLRAALDWSYDLLNEGEQALMARLSVFPGGCTLESAEAVCADFGSSTPLNPQSAIRNPQLDVLDLIVRLVDKSLVTADSQGSEVRYRMLETVRAYANEKLQDKEVYGRIVEYFVGYVEAHPTDYDALDRETTNIVAALHIAANGGMHEAVMRGANAFYHFMETRGLYALAEVLLGRAEVAARSLDGKGGLAAVLMNMGRLAERRGDYGQATACYGEGLDLAREIDDKESTSALLQNLGGVAIRQGGYGKAEGYLLEGLALARETGDKERISALLGNLGTVAGSRGDYVQADIYYQEGLALASAVGNRERVCALLQGRGLAADSRGDDEEAGVFYRESLTLAREIGHRERVSHLLQRLGVLASDSGDYAQAEEYLLEGLALARDIENRERISAILGDLGVIVGRQLKYERAEAYFDEALTIARAIGNQRLIANILDDWGETLLNRQQGDRATLIFGEALTLARELGSRDLIANALYGLARASAARGDLDAALRQGEESLSVLELIGHSGAAEVKQWLASRSVMRDL
jgi:predicted ATPase/uncharacterized protein HemY